MSKQQIKDMLKNTKYEPFRYVPALAQLIGDRPSIFLYHIHHWLNIFSMSEGQFGKFEDGRWWLNMSLSDWEEELLWPLNSIKRVRDKLVKAGIVIVEEKIDRDAPGGSRSWYSIDYDKLNEIIADENTLQGGDE